MEVATSDILTIELDFSEIDKGFNERTSIVSEPMFPQLPKGTVEQLDQMASAASSAALAVGLVGTAGQVAISGSLS